MQVGINAVMGEGADLLGNLMLQQVGPSTDVAAQPMFVNALSSFSLKHRKVERSGRP